MPRSHFLKRKIILINIVVHATYVINDELMTKLLREESPVETRMLFFLQLQEPTIKSNQINGGISLLKKSANCLIKSLAFSHFKSYKCHDPPLMFLYSPPYSSIHSYSMPHKNGTIYPVGSGTQMAITNPLRHSCLDLGPPTQYNMNRSVPKKPWKEPS